MLANYIKIALRNFRRHPGYTLINVCGLAVGIACCMLILLFVRDELSYDRFHERAERVYRVAMNAYIPNAPLDRFAVSNWLDAPNLRAEYSEVESLSRLAPWASNVKHNGRYFSGDDFFFADSTFFDVFTFPMVQGDPASALRDPLSLVMTEETEQKYFGAESGLGKTLILNDTLLFTVTGIVSDVPTNSHFTFDFLVSWATFEALQPRTDQYTYLLLRKNVSPETFEAKISDLIMRGDAGEELRSGGGRVELELQPLTKIHLHSDRNLEIGPTGDIRYVYVFAAIAAFVLLIACINFMNLSTARSMERAKEVGVRKVVGSSRTALIRQFMIESLLITFVALLFAVGIVSAALPFFNDLAGKEMTFSTLLRPLSLLGLIGLALVVGLLAGSYPAFALSRFKPVEVLKGAFKSTGRGVRLRQGLVIFQFSISVVLIAGTLIVFQQLHFMQSQNLGFDEEQVVVVNATGIPDQQMARQYQTVKQELMQHPSIQTVSASNVVPGRGNWVSVASAEHLAENESRRMQVVVVDHDFLNMMGIGLVAGRPFSAAFETDAQEAVLLNEAAVENFSWHSPEEALGKQIRFLDDREATVVGVMRNYHHQSLRQKIEPMIMCIIPPTFNYFSVRFTTEEVSALLAHLEKAWQRLFPGLAFDYFFLGNDFEKQYRTEQQIARIFGTFAFLAILIACLGLFGLASFMTAQRTKEIGVRKIHGASVGGIVMLLTRDIVKLVFISVIIAAPLAYLGLQHWLDGFAYRIELGLGVFGLTGALVLLIALVTVSYQAVKAALADPVKSLRYE